MNTEEVIISKALTGEKFSKEINSLVSTFNLSYLDAIVFYCEKNKIEIESIVSLVKSNAKIKSKLQSEAEALSFLQKKARLPI